MKIRTLKQFIIFFALIFSTNSYSNEEIPKDLVKLSVSLLTTGEGKKYLVVAHENAPHWHTYWYNPGDAGLPTTHEFFKGQDKLGLTESLAPAPKKFKEDGDIFTYGFSGKYAYFFPITFDLETTQRVKLRSTWLVCKHVCIPGKGELSFNLERDKVSEVLAEEGTFLFDFGPEEVAQQFEGLPKENNDQAAIDLTLSENPSKKGLVLYYNLAAEANDQISHENDLLIPFPSRPLDFKHEKIYRDEQGSVYGKREIDWDGLYQEPPLELPLDGKFSSPISVKFLVYSFAEKKYFITSKIFPDFVTGSNERTEAFLASLRPIEKVKLGAVAQDAQNKGASSFTWTEFFLALGLGLIGGLILNFMPCVLPIISLKLFALLRQREDGFKAIRRHNLAYSAGVIFTFMVLALIVIALKSFGPGVSWGMQLQSPTFVYLAIVVLLLMAINLFGLFEFSTPGGKFLGGLKLPQGFLGDFFNGVLATALATPCSAPFLGTALTFSFNAPALITVIVFVTIGIGLALPFILTAFMPAWIHYLPRPGRWMEVIKKFMGLTLLLTVVWLLDLFASLTTNSLLMFLNIHLTLIFFTVYLFKKFPKNITILPLVLVLLMSAIKVVKEIHSPLNQGNAKIEVSGELPWKPWTPEEMERLQSLGKLTFVDFTAKWCLTCKVNEKMVLNTEKFKNLVSTHDIELLLADWTKRDEVIGEWLKKNGKVGVPAYFVINSKKEIIDLGETISVSEIAKQLGVSEE